MIILSFTVNCSLQSFCFLLYCKICNYLVLPAGSESEQGVAHAILRGIIDFKRDPWPHVSESAKSLVRQMLEPDPKLRLTAKQVLGILLFSRCLTLDCVYWFSHSL